MSSPDGRKYSEIARGDQVGRKALESNTFVTQAAISPEPQTPGSSILRRLAAALHYRDFRVLWFGALTSTIGTWMQEVSLNWLVLTMTGAASAFYLGLQTFLGQAPILLLTLIGGVVADR